MRRKVLKLTIAIVILGGGALTVYRVFFIFMVRVPTGSMSNTIIPGDHLVVKKIVGTVERGNLIMFRSPKDSSYHISRVIGLPGETIEVRDRIVLINGKELNEQRVTVKPEDFDQPAGGLEELSSEGTGPYRVFYQSRGGSNEPVPEVPFGRMNSPFRIPLNQYFVMGDNRDNSFDSRFWGGVTRDAIAGKPSAIYLSLQRLQSGEEQVRWERMFTKVK